MLKISTLLSEAATSAAKTMLENGLSEGKIPTMESYFLSKNGEVPRGYVKIGNVEVNGSLFHIFQLL